jgi:hypothetical protein
MTWPFVVPSDDVGPFPKIVNDWVEAEQVSAAWVRRFGYRDAEATGAGTDRGIDVLASGAIAQSKWWNQNIGIKDVQRLQGTAKPWQACFFFAKHGYTKEADEWASGPGNRVALFILRDDGRITPYNALAQRALRRAPMQLPADSIRPTSIVFKLISVATALCLVLSALICAFAVPSDVKLNGVALVIWLYFVVASLILAVAIGSQHRSDFRRLCKAVRCFRANGIWLGWRYVLKDTLTVRDAHLPCDRFVGILQPSFPVRIFYFCIYVGQFMVTIRGWISAKSSRVQRVSIT